MAQQVFSQWSPVVKAHNEDQQEVYIPAAIIHAQTRDGKDELIVGAANMQFDPETGDYLPTHAGNPVEVRARALETLLQTLGKEETLALVKAALDVLVSKDFATQTTLAAVLEKLADLATESTLDGVKSAVDALAGTVDAGAQKVTLSGTTVDMATESTLSSLASAVAKETTLAQVLSALGALATETTLGGVKTAVDVLAGTVDTQAGVQKVALSGRNARVIHTVSVSNVGPGGARHLGVTATTTATADPLDISPYVTKHVEVRNTGTTEITIASLRFYKQTGSQDGNNFYYEANVEIQLPAGARVTLTPQEVPVLRDPHIAMILRIVNSSTDGGGAAEVTFMGGFA